MDAAVLYFVVLYEAVALIGVTALALALNRSLQRKVRKMISEVSAVKDATAGLATAVGLVSAKIDNLKGQALSAEDRTALTEAAGNITQAAQALVTLAQS